MILTMEEYKSIAHAKTRIRYHLVFSTKYRRKCLTGIEDCVYSAFRKVESESDFSIIDMAIDDGDHIHLAITFKPSLSILQVVRRIKQMTTWIIWIECGSKLRRFYWNRKVLWSGGYFVSTIGSVSDKTVLRYIQKQK